MMVESVRRACAAAAIPAPGSASAVSSASEKPNPLKEFGFEATVDGVSRCLAQFSLDNEAVARIKQLLVKLGDEDYFVRESASEALLRYHVLPTRLLQGAAQTNDFEVRCRVKRILKSRGVEHTKKMLAAALRTIQQERLSGFAAEVVHAVSSHDADSSLEGWQAIVGNRVVDRDTLKLSFPASKTTESLTWLTVTGAGCCE